MKPIYHAALIAALCGCWSGCNRESQRRIDISSSRIVKRELELGLSLSDRFKSKRRAAEAEPGGPPTLAFDTPPEWRRTAGSQYRLLGFDTPGGGDCSVSRSGGTLVMNVNRWRNQFGLPPISAAEASALPKRRFGLIDGSVVELDGDYTGMGTQQVAGAKLLGLIARVDDDLSLFVKLVGPSAAVDAQRENFFALAASLRPEQDPAADRQALADPSALRWTIPATWQVRESASRARVVTVGPSGHSDANCWVIAFPGAVGGIPGNVNRWLGEIGLGALGDAEIAKLPRVEMFGTQGILVEGYGDYSGQDGSQAASGLLGVLCPLGSYTLFVKMVGPADVVRAEKVNFLAFCASLGV